MKSDSSDKYYKIEKTRLVRQCEKAISKAQSEDYMGELPWTATKARLNIYHKQIKYKSVPLDDIVKVDMGSNDAGSNDAGSNPVSNDAGSNPVSNDAGFWYALQSCPDDDVDKFTSSKTFHTYELKTVIEYIDNVLRKSIRLMTAAHPNLQGQWAEYINIVISMRYKCIENYWNNDKNTRPVINSETPKILYSSLAANNLLPPSKLATEIINILKK